jgi:flagellar assembly factor FliW
MEHQAKASAGSATSVQPTANHAVSDLSHTTPEIGFPQGLVGCPTWQKFSLTPQPFEGFGDLISIDEPGIALLVADPAWLRLDYSFELDDEDAEALKLTSPDDAQVLCILNLQREPAMVLANLAGPLVINKQYSIGRQVVLDHQAYPLRAPILTGEAAQDVIDAFYEGVADTERRAGAPQTTAQRGVGKGA